MSTVVSSSATVANTSAAWRNRSAQPGATGNLIRLFVFLLLALSPFDAIVQALQGGTVDLLSRVSSGLIISSGLVVLSLARIIRVLEASMLARGIFLLTFFLVPGATVAILRGKTSAEEVLIFLMSWLGYTLLALAVAGWVRDIDFSNTIYWAVTPSLLVMVILSFVDYYSGIDIPYINDWRAQELFIEGELVGAMIGPFVSRTQAGVILEGLVIFLLAYAFVTPIKWQCSLSLLTVASSVLFMLHTGNRSFFLSITVAGFVLFVILWSWRRKRDIHLGRLVLFPVAGLVGVFLLSMLFPYQMAFYLSRIDEVLAQGSLNASDLSRVDLFIVALESFLEGNVLGNGPTLIPHQGLGQDMNPHSIVTALLWSGGLLGLLWIVIIVLLVVRYFMIIKNVQSKAVLYFIPLVAFFVGGFAHFSLGNANFWLFIGLFTGMTLQVDRHSSAKMSLRRQGVLVAKSSDGFVK